MKKLLLASIAIVSLTMTAKAADYYQPAPSVPVTMGWSGFYVGGVLGYDFGDWDGKHVYLEDPSVFDPAAHSKSFDGLNGGFTAGVNYDLGNFVLGLESDFVWTGADWDHYKRTGDGSGSVAWDTSHDMNWLTTARLRAGMKLGDSGNWLVYGTGGLAAAEIDSSIDVLTEVGTPNEVQTASGKSTNTHVGWTAGLGAEYAISSNFTVKGEWLYTDLGNASYHYSGEKQGPLSGPYYTDKTPSDITMHTLRLGINYKF